MPSRTRVYVCVRADAHGTLLSETMGPRKRLPPLLVPLTDRRPERLHYLGACGRCLLAWPKQGRWLALCLRLPVPPSQLLLSLLSLSLCF